jgi:lipoate---protein ligase
MLQTINTGVFPAEAIMRLDDKLLTELDPNGVPILHLYDWDGPSATFGHFIDPRKHIDLEKARKYPLALARRPTGGGIVFHIWDLAFSFLMPSGHSAFSLNTLQNYRFVNGIVLEVMRSFFSLQEEVELIPQEGELLSPDCQNFCMAKSTQYDVIYKGMKIAGAAQRKRKQGYLHQGTLSLASPDFDFLNEILLSKKEVLQAMQKDSFYPMGSVDPKKLKEARFEIQKLLADKLMRALNSLDLCQRQKQPLLPLAQKTMPNGTRAF